MRRCLATLIALLACGSLLSAQQNKVSAPHKPIAPLVTKRVPWPNPATQRSMVGGLWMTDANFKSAIYLKNVVETDPITVTPILWLSNGAKYLLPDVKLEPAGTVIVDINAALESKGISSWATLSGYVELQYTWPWDPICATVRDIDVAHSLIFTYGLRTRSSIPDASAAATSHIVEGMWWKQEANITGFVALTNISSQATRATVLVSDNQGKALIQHTVTISPQGMKTVHLDELQSISATEGGVRVTYDSPTESLIVNGGLQDQAVGYSAALHFGHESEPLVPPGAARAVASMVAEVGLMVGAADPMMSFPAGTTFTPYSVLRNVSHTAISVKPVLWRMQAGQAVSAQLPPLTLQPFETRSLDLMSLMSSAGLKNFNGSVNLVFEAQGDPSGLLMAAGSVDQTNTYVFEVAAHGIVESAGKSHPYWSTGNGDDTMVTLWNPADEAQDFNFKLFFSGGHYILPIHLEARATRTLNISEIIQNQIPDAEGSVIPSAVHEGSMKIVGSQADNQAILVAMDSGVYNVRKATCGPPTCYTCDGWDGTAILASPFGVGVSGKNQLNWTLTWNTGQQYNYNASGSTWASDHTNVATVSTGLTTGISPGHVNVTTNNPNPPVYIASTCSYTGDPCPLSFGSAGQSNGNVFKVTGVNPANLVLGTGVPPLISGTLTISGTGFSTLVSPTAQFDSGTGITTGAPSVLSDTTMTVSYSVGCSAVVGTYNLMVGDSVDGGISGASTWPESVVLPSAPAATLKLGGQSISGTQSVVVGQQIALSALVGLPQCMSLASQQWSTPPGTANGGYAASVSSGSVTPLPSNTNSSYTFYWVTAGNPVNVTYRYTMSGGGSSAGSPVSSATFNVAGPTAVSEAIQLGTINISNNKLVFGGSGSNIGIKFTPSATAPSGYSNTWQYVQVINSVTIQLTGSTSHTCPGSGLDGSYPYPVVTSTYTDDNPGVGLSTSYTEESYTMSANMYTMWNSGLPNSIPVPLGYVSWNWYGDAKYSSGAWQLQTSSNRSASAFIASTSYPTWTTDYPLGSTCP